VWLEGSPETRHVLLKRSLGVSRWLLAPELVDEPVARHRLAGVEKEDREDAALSRPTERKSTFAVIYLERAEYEEIERPGQIANVPRCAVSPLTAA
jgi:hypothetical protein